jgi:hypothetical protein
VKVSNREGIANQTGPESCVAHREVRDEALTGEPAGQPLSRESFKLVQGADAVSVAEGKRIGAIKRVPVRPFPRSLPLAPPTPLRYPRIVLTASRSEPVREPEEIFFVDCIQHLHHGTLNDLIFQRGDGGFKLHLIQWSLGIGSILMRLEVVTRAFNSDSFCGLMVSQYGAVFVSLRVGICPLVGSSSRRPRRRSESTEPVL